MGQNRVLIVGASPTESLQLEELLQQASYSADVRSIGSHLPPERFPDWQDWDLVLIRYTPQAAGSLLPQVAPLLRWGKPPVFFLVDEFTSEQVLYLLNIGGQRVLPMSQVKTSLVACLNAVLVPARQMMPLPVVEPAGLAEDIPLPPSDFQRLFANNPLAICILRERGNCTYPILLYRVRFYQRPSKT